jgi:hypothetical protein
VDLRAELDAACTPEVLFAQVADLDTYPGWLTIVSRTAEVEVHHDTSTDPAADPGTDGGVGGEPSPAAWLVDLRGRLGPIARSKRLRMVRTVSEPNRRVRFERRELDGRNHAAWVLEASIDAHEVPGGAVHSRLTVDLHYGGTFGGALLRRMLDEEIERSRPRLSELALVAQRDADVAAAEAARGSEQRP